MSCSKAQLILLLSHVIDLVAKSRDKDEALEKLWKLKADLEERSVEDFLREWML